jgi:hypothetical protein
MTSFIAGLGAHAVSAHIFSAATIIFTVGSSGDPQWEDWPIAGDAAAKDHAIAAAAAGNLMCCF